MQFQVPQFIDIEDKIIGPLTIKQFLYLLGGGFALVFLWMRLTLGFFIIVSVPVVLFSLALAFYKVNGRSLIHYLGSLILYLLKPRLYLWKKRGENDKKGIL